MSRRIWRPSRGPRLRTQVEVIYRVGHHWETISPTFERARVEVPGDRRKPVRVSPRVYR